MQGIELSRRFYWEVVRPWLDATAPGLSHSAAITGYGSELLGFDDETSKDHNWGPRVQIFLADQAFAENAERLVETFLEAAPSHFLGEPIGYRSRPHPPVSDAGRAGNKAHGVEVLTVAAHLQDSLGISSIDGISSTQWLGFAEQRLLVLTAGAVFHDDQRRLSEARRALAYFPNDVWLYKIASQWKRIAEEQAFVGRTGQVGDDLGSRVIAARLARDVMRMGFLLERQYAPSAKWLGSAFARLPISTALTPLLTRALTTTDWRDRGDALASAYLVLAKRQRTDKLAGQVEPIVGPYHERPFSTINADDFVAACLGQIEDPLLRSLPVIGSLDQITDMTPVLVDPNASHRLVRAVFDWK
ncbi:MAG TPA: DUF4037 domain-containing protein [Devosia sp.]|jgi:hypothetical protein|uniref:DUF4037 domain-containing protein n=1 Tax=Devosia sp. TaxID=1871048 RepID=UPI002F956C41